MNARSPHSLTHDHRVKPPAAPLASGHDTKLVPLLAEELTDLVVLLGRKRPLTHPGCIGLCNTENIVDSRRPKSRAGRRLPGHGIGRGHERIGAVIIVEQGPLGALEQNAFAAFAPLVEQFPNPVHERQDLVGHCHQFIMDCLRRNLGRPHAAPQRIVVGQKPLDLVHQRFRLGQIANPDRPTANLVLIGRPDPASGRADLESGIGVLAQRVQFTVQREDQRRILGDAQNLGRHRNALPGNLVDFGNEVVRIDHNAIADH